MLNLKFLNNFNNFLPKSFQLSITNENKNLNNLIFYIEPLRNFLEILQKVPGYSIEIFLKRIPRLVNEPYTKEMGLKIAKKVTEKSVVRLVKIAAGVVFEMLFKKFLASKIILLSICNPIFFIPNVESAENIKIVYSLFSRTIDVNELKNFAIEGKSTKDLNRILKSTGSSNSEIQTILNKDFEIPITIANKLIYSEIGNVFLTRLSSIIHPPKAKDDLTGTLALRASVIQGINFGKGKINLINFLKLTQLKLLF